MRAFIQGSIVLCLFSYCYTAIPSKDEVLAALAKAKKIGLTEEKLEKIEQNREGKTSPKCLMSLSHGKRMHGDVDMDKNVNAQIRAMRILQSENNHSLEEVTHEDVLHVFKTTNGGTCNVAKPPEECDPDAKYRSADGSCNNLNNPEWGMAGRSQERLLPNKYDDKLGLPRTVGINKKPLPNARLISNKIHNAVGLNVDRSQNLTLHAMGFGQFLDHDLTLTPLISAVEQCCDKTAKDDIDNCFNIISQEDDEFQPIFSKDHCIEFKRSAPVLCPDSQSNGKPVRQQINAITAFIDGSNVYGSSLERQKSLRDGESGTGFLLKTSTLRNAERILNGDSADCVLTESGQHCSKAGDVRVNEVPSLTAYHYLFVKEHNRIANILKDFYPKTGSDEIIFQETRKLVIAIMQTIVYDQFLPSFLTDDTIKRYRLKTSEDYTYEARINPTILNEFAVAAYRMGHSWISPEMILFNKAFKPLGKGEVKTEETFHNPSLTYRPKAFNKLMYGLSGVASPGTDRFLVEAVRSNLFLDKAEGFALDLAALNIQRGRDHGIGTFYDYMEYCRLDRVQENWNEDISEKFVDGVKDKVVETGYDLPGDIDLFTGGLIEKTVNGALLGATLECLIGEQFKRLKYGDRFWFQSKTANYNQKQIDEIRKYTFSKILCKNFGYNTVQFPNAFKLTDKMKKCSEIDDINFSVFDPR